MKIANIVIDTPIKVNNKFNVVDSFDKIIKGIPTLLVGLNHVRNIDPKPDFLDRKLSEDVYWTFSKKEKRVLFEEDLFYFTEAIYKNIIKKTKYRFIDLILTNSSEILLILSEINKIKKIITLKHKNMLYIYGDNIIFGFDLKQVTFIGSDTIKLIDLIKNLSDVFLEDDNILIEYNNDLEMFNYETKYIPILYTMNQDE
jgi:hypothetical protein